jgi:hypothetical protein
MNESEKDSIFMQHLRDQHSRSLSHVDALDMKIAQGIALSGIVLSFIFDKLWNANSQFIFAAGLFLILISIGLGACAFRCATCKDGPSGDFYFNSSVDTEDLKKQLVRELDHNNEIQSEKAKWFDLMLIFNIIGLASLIIGYYV